MKLLEKIINQDTYTVNWEEVWKIPEFKVLKDTKQNPKWHSEGNVDIHTINVVNEMYQLVPYTENDRFMSDMRHQRRLIMVAAALFHDIGKGATTKWNDEKGALSSPRHAPVGEQITRRLLWDEDFFIREKICSLVRNHMKPLYVYDSVNPTRDVIFLAEEPVTLSDLLTLKTADCQGAKQMEEDNWRDKIEYARQMAEDVDCLKKPYSFFNEYSRFIFFHNQLMNYPIELYDSSVDEPNFTVYFMIGLPGSGKDTYIKNHFPNIPTVCRDDIRTEIGLKGEKPMGNKKQEDEVTRIQDERILNYARKRQSFIINATNLKRMYRDGFKGMLKPYNPRIEYVYVEAPSFDKTLERRKGTIPQDVIKKMRDNFEFPHPNEAYSIMVDVQRKSIYGTTSDYDGKDR